MSASLRGTLNRAGGREAFGDAWISLRSLSGSADLGEEPLELGREAAPGRLVREPDVVCALDLDEARPRNAGRQLDAILDRDDRIVAAVQHQRRRLDQGELAADVEVAQRRQDGRGILRRRASPLQFVEPLHVVLRRAGEEGGGEDLSEGRVPPAPALPHELDQRLELLRDTALANGSPASGAAADEDQPRDAIWVSRRIGRRP